MKISLNKIRNAHKHYGPEGLASEGIDKLVEKIGAQLGAVEEVVSYGDKFDGVVIVKVVTCEKHPDADKLSVCTIDDGGITPDVNRGKDGLVQVVCGAPNVHGGMRAAWLPPGATVPSSRGSEPFVLEARELRGVVSNGMLASPKELGIGEGHEGILEVDAEVKPGTSFAAAYRLEGEAIIDIENKMFTHRPDCFGWMGLIREISGIEHKAFKSPDWYVPQPELPPVEADELKLSVTNEVPALTPRFVAVAMSGIEIRPSPVWLQIVLNEAGIRPINNVVDYTNFWMLETGQPLHAYDYDKVKALSGGEAALVVRNPKPNEKLTLLNGKTIEPRSEAILIATDKQPIGLAGVMGGGETEVDENTKSIILESATFDMYSIRRTSMAHGLFTDAVTRFNKGQSPLQNLAVLSQIVDSLRRDAGAKVASAVIDDNHLDPAVQERGSLHQSITLSVGFANERLGLTLSADEMKSLLENVEFKVSVSGDELSVTAPFWRTDVEIREDVVEEIGRLHGYDNLPLTLPLRDLTPAPKNELMELKSAVRRSLATSGANEVLTYSFVHGDLLKKAGQDPEDAFTVSNALSPDLQYYRLSLTPSLLDKVHMNIKAGFDEFALFEIGKGHNLKHSSDDDGLPMEFEMLDLVYARSDKVRKPGAAYYEARKFLVDLAADFGVELEFRPFAAEEDYPVVKPYDHTRSAQVFVAGSDIPLGMVGEYKAAVRSKLKLPKYSAGFGIGLAQLLQAAGRNTYVPLPRFPKVTQDITLRVPADTAYQTVYDSVRAELAKVQPQNSLPSLGPVDIYQAPDDPSHKNITLRFTIASYEKTLTDAEVNAMLDAAAAAAREKFGAERL